MLKHILKSHPLFFALFPSIVLYSVNIADFSIEQIYRSSIILLMFGFALVLVGWMVTRDFERATLLGSLILFFSMNYGHVYIDIRVSASKFLKTIEPDFNFDSISLGVHILLLIVWMALLMVIYRVVMRRKQFRDKTPQFLFLVGLIALLVPITRIIWSWGEIRSELTKEYSRIDINIDSAPNDELGMPDVYYIILDAYGREDILTEFYQYDNSFFIDGLEEQGFYIASDSRSNYSNTATSLASSFNMSYLEEEIDMPSDDLPCRMILAQLIGSNQVMEIFRDLGYKFIAFSTGFRTTEIKSADLFLQPKEVGLNPFESSLVFHSILMPIFNFSSALNIPLEYPGYSGHRARISFALDQLSKLPKDLSPKFVFAHIVAPHPPFVFDPEGRAVDQQFPFVIWDGDMFPGTYEEYIRGYSDQVSYLNRSILNWVTELLDSSNPGPIIILQGDHGPRSTMQWRAPSQDAMREATAILNAYYLPGVDKSVLYDDISPVNTFRVVLNSYFNAGLDLLEDRTFFMSTGCQDFSYELK